MPNLKVVSTLEIEIVVEHIGGNVNQAGTKKSEKEQVPVKLISQLPGDDASQDYRYKRGLEKRNSHSLEPQRDEGWP